jgi:hypothetical protein
MSNGIININVYVLRCAVWEYTRLTDVEMV